MAETVVNFVLAKLSDAAVNEVLLLRGLDKQVEKVKRELVWIQAFLKDADSRQMRDERQRNWVKQVRDIAYWIEDVVDSAFLLDDSTERPQGNSGFTRKINAVKKIFRKPRKLPALHNLGIEIYEILARIKEINESRITYGISDLGEGSGEPLRLPIRLHVLPDIDDPDVVGFNEDMDNIVKQLLDENTKRRCVVSIVGTGGIGKTTLARKAYNRFDIKSHFDNRIWVTVSKEFKLIKVLKKMVKQFRPIESSEHEEGEEYFLVKLNECCTGKRYLIVLDDVWTNHFWSHVKEALPDEKNGSRVLFTTRSLDVASEADSAIEPYKLKFLTEEFSLELLLKKALPNQYSSKEYPNDLVDLAKQFVKKCGGLPLALVILGGLLSKKLDHHAWSTIMRTMNWGIDGIACTEVIAISYDDLPLTLKQCFMYFALFPEDFFINAKALIRMWLAEGLIPEVKNRTLEDTGESFMNELVQRCMIQELSRSHDGSIDVCRIHDLLHDLAIQKAKEDNFLTVYSNEDDLTSCCSARRIAVHNSDCGQILKNANPNLRSLMCFGPSPDCSKQRLLKVLRTEEIEFKWLEGSTQIRYFEYCKWRNPNEDLYFDKFICNMKFLQTLDLRFADHGDLPDCIWLVKTLRHVLLCKHRFTSGPPSGADLRNLQTLTRAKSRKSWATKTGIPYLLNLRTLNIEIVKGLLWEVIATLLDTLKHLLSLELISNDVTFKVPDMRRFPSYQHLQFLWLSCYADNEVPLDINTNSMHLDTNMFPIHLIVLTFDGLQLDQDPMPILEKLQNLKILSIWRLEYHKKQMRFSAKNFVQLQQLELDYISNLEELEIEEGAMPMLKELTIRSCRQLCVPLGLQHLTSLKKLDWHLSWDDLASTKADEMRNVCKHVPTLNIW